MIKLLSISALVCTFTISLSAIDGYNTTFDQVKMSNPTNFSPNIKANLKKDVEKKKVDFGTMNTKNPNNKYTVENGKAVPRSNDWREVMKRNHERSTQPGSKSNSPTKIKQKLLRKMLIQLRSIDLKAVKEDQISLRKYEQCIAKLSLTSIEDFKKCESRKSIALQKTGRQKNKELKKLKTTYKAAKAKYKVE